MPNNARFRERLSLSRPLNLPLMALFAAVLVLAVPPALARLEVAPAPAPPPPAEPAKKKADDKKDAPPKTAKQVFKDAGLTFHGEMVGFLASGRPAKTERGITVTGTLPSNGPNIYVGPKALWRLEGNEIDIIGKPHLGPGANKPWGIFHQLTPSGWLVATTYDNRSRTGNSTAHAYVYNVMDDQIIHLKPGKDKAYTRIYPYDINPSGQVVGQVSHTNTIHAFTWTKKTGIVELRRESSTYEQAIAINNKGMIAGISNRDGVNQPRIWMPPGKDGKRKAKTLDLPEGGYNYAYVRGINNDGVVLINCFRQTPVNFNGRGFHSGHTTTSDTYLWSDKNGYKKIEKPKFVYSNVAVIDKHGRVLLQGWKQFDAQTGFSSKTSEYHLTDGKTTLRLPDYPGAASTSYGYMSEEGLIVGTAHFNTHPKTQKKTFVCFVISLNDQKEKPKKNE